MTVRAGDTAQKTTEVVCSKCGKKVHVNQGKQIPKCSCGNENFNEGPSEASARGSR